MVTSSIPVNAFRPIKGPKKVLLDSSLFGQVLVRGTHTLSFFTYLARDGKISLFIPHLVVQEVLSNIPLWTNKQFCPDKDENMQREARKCGLDPLLAAEADAASKKAYDSACTDFATRFNEWCKHSLGEILPLTLAQSEGPFNVKKNKEHLPDAHIFQSVRAFAESRGECAFISSDNNLGEHIQLLDGVEWFKTPSDLFDALGLSTTFNAARSSMPKLKGISLSNERISDCVQKGLLNRHLNLEGREWIIDAVDVTSASARAQSTTQMLENNLLVGISASTDLKLISRTKTATEIITADGTASVELEGGIVVNGESLSAELDEYTFLTLPIVADEKQTISPCDAAVTLESYYQDDCRKHFAKISSGVILVTGGNVRERRKMTEWLCSTLRSIRNKQDYALRLFPLHESLPGVHEDKLGDHKLDEYVTLHSADIVAVEENKPFNLRDVLLAAEANQSAFIICALGTCMGTDAAIRAVSKVDIGTDCLEYLECVVNFTKRDKRGAVFNFHTRSQWAGPRWHATLKRDEMFRPRDSD